MRGWYGPLTWRPFVVSIGLPTYNRAAGLERAIESVLAQTHAELELIVSDNASTDGTPQLCRRLSARDPRLRYVRHEVNRGPTANFNFLFGELRGDYAMLLADDDWLDADYVATCLAELRRLPDHAVVGGRHRWMRDSQAAGDGVLMTLEHDDPCRRTLGYLRRVDDNGTFYGLIRGEALRCVGPMPNVLGNDWLHVAALAFRGKVRTLPQTRVNRSLGGTSRTLGDIVTTFGGARPGEARLAFVFIAARVFAQIAWRSDVYAQLPPPRRLAFAARAFAAALRVKGTLWLLLGPLTLAVLGRPRGRLLLRRLEWVLRRGGRGLDSLPPL